MSYLYNKKQRLKKLKIISTIVVATIGLLYLVIETFFSKPEIEQNIDSVNQWVSVVQNNWDIQQNNIIQKSPLEIENEKHRSDNKAKIRGFFVYWNHAEYLSWINNIDLDIQHIFTEQKMKSFWENMTYVFEIIENKERWEISNSEFEVDTKHNVKIKYWYNHREYIDQLFIIVQRNKKDLYQHHITQMRCEWTSWPLCDFLKK